MLVEILRKRSAQVTPLATKISASISFHVDDGTGATLFIDHGSVRVKRDPRKRADTHIRSDFDTLNTVLTGKQSGVAAFLEGRLTVRGNLALAMTLESLFEAPPDAGPQVKAGFVRAAGVKTFYLEAGEGPPLILLHGLGGTNASMLPTLQAFQKTHRVIAPDNPGFGESEKPIRAYHPGFFARWLNAFLDELGISNASLVGNSMGGRIALEMGIRHPEKVDRLVLYAPSMAWKRFRQFVPVVNVLAPELAIVPLRLPRGQVMRTLKLLFAKPERLQQRWYDAAVDEFLRVFKSPKARVAFFSAAKHIYLERPHGPRGFWKRLGMLDKDALFIWGAKDILVPASFAAHTQEVLPHGKSVILPDCGHIPQFEHAALTHNLAAEFLGVDLKS